MSKLISKLCGGLALSVAVNANAGLINFETTHLGNTPADNQLIDFCDTYEVDGVSVRFGFDSDYDGVLDAKAAFEQVGSKDKKTGFVGENGAKDIAAEGYEDQLGDFFIRQKKSYKPFGIFTVLYDSAQPVTAASGEIWDIDGGKKTEQFLVQAFNNDALLSSVLSPVGNSALLDGKPWTFGFSGLIDITKIEISFVGSKTSGIGFAFNNFSPVVNQAVNGLASVSQVPEPKGILLLGLGLMAIGWKAQHKKGRIAAAERMNK